MEKYNFKYDDFILYDNGHIKGLGVVVGCASMENPVIGRNYIIKPISPRSIQSETYPFEVFTCFENQIKLVYPELKIK